MRPPPRPHPFARAPLVDRLNRLFARGFASGWMPEPTLDMDELWRRGARGYTQHDELGGRDAEDAADFRERFGRLCDAARREAALNALGRTFAYGQLVRAVRQRHALGALWRRRLGLANTPIAPPIIVVGQMRSGTTRIHRLLAADPAHAATRFCDSWHPVPPHSRRRPDLRPAWGGFKLWAARRLDPWIDALHPMSASRAEEELGWLAAALDHSTYEAQWHIPSYSRWSEERDPLPVYREFARLLRTDAAHHRNADRPRVLKVPQFSEDLATLLAIFPDAKVVVARRNHPDVLRSVTSVVANQVAIQSDEGRLEPIEAEWRRKLPMREERIAAALAQFSGPVAQVDFDDLDRDWSGEIERLYRALGLPFGAPAREALQREHRRQKTGAHRHHGEQLTRFETDRNEAA